MRSGGGWRRCGWVICWREMQRKRIEKDKLSGGDRNNASLLSKHNRQWSRVSVCGFSDEIAINYSKDRFTSPKKRQNGTFHFSGSVRCFLLCVSCYKRSANAARRAPNNSVHSIYQRTTFCCRNCLWAFFIRRHSTEIDPLK